MYNCTSCAQVRELVQSHYGGNWEGTLFMIAYLYYAHLASVRFEHSVCCGSLMTTYITLLAWHVEHSLVHWYQQCVTVHHVTRAQVATKPLW